MNKLSILMLALAFCLFGQEANAQDKKTAKPKVLDETTWAWGGSKDNYATLKDMAFEVGMGNERNGVGIAEVGLEIENLNWLSVTVDASPFFTRHDDNSFAGFVVDYHTAEGYTKRVSLPMGFYSQKKWSDNPRWGKRGKADQFIDMGKKKEYHLDLRQWAPVGWDGKLWFSVSLQNSGRNTRLKGTITFPSEEKQTLTAKAVVGVYSRVYFDRSNESVPTADLEFTADGKVLESGLQTAKWSVKGNAVIVVIDDEQFGIATLKPESENRLVGINTHKNGNQFKWVLTKKAEVAQKPKEEPGKAATLTDEHHSTVRTFVSILKEAATSLRSAQDEQSAEKTSDDLKRLAARLLELNIKAGKLPQLAEADKQQLRKTHSDDVREMLSDTLEANEVFRNSLKRMSQEKSIPPQALQNLLSSHKAFIGALATNRGGVIASWKLFVSEDTDLTWDYFLLTALRNRTSFAL